MTKGSMAKHLMLMMPLLAGMLLSACENDLKQLKKISQQEGSKPVDRTTNVDVIFSDSAKVKAHMITPLMLQYNKIEKPYMVMPKGVKVTFYDEQLHVTSTIVADSAIHRDKEQVTEMYRNVVATNVKGDIFKSDELLFNQLTHKVISRKPVTITMAAGNVIHGDALETNEKFDPWTIPNTTGKFHVSPNMAQQ